MRSWRFLDAVLTVPAAMSDKALRRPLGYEHRSNIADQLLESSVHSWWPAGNIYVVADQKIRCEIARSPTHTAFTHRADMYKLTIHPHALYVIAIASARRTVRADANAKPAVLIDGAR